MDNLIPISPLQYASLMKVTKATACNWARAYVEGQAELPANVSKVERVGKAWLLYVPFEMAKSVISVT